MRMSGTIEASARAFSRAKCAETPIWRDGELHSVASTIEMEALEWIGQFIAAAHHMMMHDADYRAWSEAHRISPELEYAIRRHLIESESFLQ